MAIALAAAPLYVVRFHIGIPTTLLELVLVPAIACGLFAYWPELRWSTPFTVPAVVLLLGATLDTYFTPERVKGAGLWKAYFVEPMLAAVVMTAIARERQRARLLLAGLAVACLVVVAAEVRLQVPLILEHQYNFKTPQSAIYTTANAIPLFLEAPAALALAIALHGDRRLDRVLAGLTYAASVVEIGLSFSRLGWVAVIVLTLAVAAFHRRRWWVLGGAALVGLAAFAGSSSIRERVLVEFRPDDPYNTIGLRTVLWRSTLNMLSHQPVFGGGLSGFRDSIEAYRDPGYREDLIYPHNLFLNFWTETGLIGLAGAVALFVQGFRHAWRWTRLEDAWARAVAIGMFAALLAIAVHGLGDAPYFKNDLSLVFWTVLAVPFGIVAGAGRADNRSQP